MKKHHESQSLEWNEVEARFSGVFLRTFLLLVLIVLGGTWFFSSHAAGLLVPEPSARTVTPRGDLAGDEHAYIELFQNASPSVVHIETSLVQSLSDRLRGQTTLEGSGSGFLWDAAGHVVTNFHVIQRAERMKVHLQDGSTWSAHTVGFARDFDLAVLKIDLPSDQARPLPLGTSGDLQVGQKVFAIGNPFGLDQTLTTGIISGLNRSIGSRGKFEIHGVIQTDAAINPGNSGGPLLDSAGRLIGVNTSIASTSGTYSGIGFAVPVDTVNRVVPRILREGEVHRAYLGIFTGEDLWARDKGFEGAVIRSVESGGPAEAAGLRGVELDAGELLLGDIIVGIDDFVVSCNNDLYRALEDYGVGDTVRVTIYRAFGGQWGTLEIDIELGERS